MATFKTLSGEELEYPDPSPELAAFMRCLLALMHDPTKSEDDFIALMYGRENPLLDQTVFRDRGAVTKAVFADPTYHVMLDMLDQKRVQAGTLDTSQVEARHTMTVGEAAAKLGVHETAVRQAIAAHRLPAVKRDGRWCLDPVDVENFEVHRRGPSPALEVRYGATTGKSFKIAVNGSLEVRKKESGAVASIEGVVPSGWKRFAVLSSFGDDARFYELEPGGQEEEIAFDDWYVRGRFTVARKINNSREARQAFDAIRKDPTTGVVLFSPTKGRPAATPEIEFVRELDHVPEGGPVDSYNVRLFEVMRPGRKPQPVYIWTSGHFLDETRGLSTSTRFDEAALRALYREIIEAHIREHALSNHLQVGRANIGRWGQRFVAIAKR